MTDAYAVIGNPVAQSRSPDIHAAFAAETGQDLRYDRIEAPPDGFAAAAAAFRRGGGRGLNVTAPFKEDAFRFATTLSPRAQAAGAVNCLTWEPGGGLRGDNFDGVGLRRDLEDNLRQTLRGCRVLLLGAGGAVRGVLGPLGEAGPAALVVANRTQAHAAALAESFGPGVAARSLEALAAEPPFDVVVNGTSAGLFGGGPAVPAAAFHPGGLAYDMTYGRGLTPFLAAAAAAGVARLHDGIGMLVEQAADAFALWRGVRPHTAPVISRLAVPLR